LNAATPLVVVSTGEPAGIGPDICLALATELLAGRPVFLGNATLLAKRAAQLKLDVALRVLDTPDAARAHEPGVLQLLDIELGAEAVAGTLNPANARYVLTQIERGVALCASGKCAAFVTAPVQKSVINEAGIPFSGHTEYLAELTNAPQPVMMLVSERLKVALVTTHLALTDVARHVDAPRLERVIAVLEHDLRQRFGIAAPRIRVLGLNPHAGESGVLGGEELAIIIPTLERLRTRGMRLLGPTPADTAFTAAALADTDVVLAMYHDQGLPAIKALAFGQIVNVTLGLPIIRTSVDHGTALDLAGSGAARHASLARAYALAAELAARAQH